MVSTQLHTPAEIARRGQEIYDTNLRPLVESKHMGQFLVVDITTGGFEIAEDDLTASDRALAKNPDAVLYGLRIGSPAAYRLGGSFLVKESCHAAWISANS